MSTDVLEQAREHFVAGVREFEAGRLDAAERCFEAALALVPARPSVLVNLAAVRIRLGRPAEALAALDAASIGAPHDPEIWFDRGHCLQALERPAEALAAYERVIALDPTATKAHGQRGQILKDMRRFDEAAASLRRAIELGGDDVELHRWLLASIEGGAQAPAAAPRAYVEGLFDSYAEQFDEHLTGKLGYRTPQLLTELLLRCRAAGEPRFGSALDLGCGTGLMAPLLAPHCDAIDGVDLSSRMLQKAAALELYRTLVHGDVVEHLRSTGERHDLVIAADVFVYVGALDAVFDGSKRVLRPGGRFVFSVEEATGAQALELRPSSRYAHAERYVLEQASRCGFTVEATERAPLRRDQQAVIGGLCFVLGVEGG